MIISGGGRYTGPKEVKYLFIDGGYLRKVIEGISKRYFDGELIDISFERISTGFTKTFYYDCPAPKKRNETDEEYQEKLKKQKIFFNKIRNQRGYHVFEGVVTGEPGKTRQKQIDVKIAVDMLVHTIRGNMHQATFIAGDQDFKPLIEALVQEGMYITIWCETKHTSPELIYSADDRQYLNIQTLYDAFPQKIKDKFPLPSFYQGLKDTEDYKLIKKGKNDKGDWIELYQKDSHYLFVYESPTPDQAIHVKYANLDFLFKYIEDVRFFKCKWE